MHMGQIWVIKLVWATSALIQISWVNAGYSATNAESSNFIGNNAGFKHQMLIIQIYWSAAGYNASGAYSSNFFGQ
jgi:hypothetical protein